MRATRRRRKGQVIALLASLASGAIACETSPMDMWITMNPEAGANFDAPPRDVGSRDAGDDTSGTGGTGGTGGSDGTGGTSGAAGDTGSGTAGTTGSGGGGTGGDAGSGGGAGMGGAGGNN
jgi:hypothetical protein